jgi:hypothetical protein
MVNFMAESLIVMIKQVKIQIMLAIRYLLAIITPIFNS